MKTEKKKMSIEREIMNQFLNGMSMTRISRKRSIPLETVEQAVRHEMNRPVNWRLWDHMFAAHGLLLIEDEMEEIRSICRKIERVQKAKRS
jgi:hypothetical protein